MDNIDGFVTGAGFPDWGYHGYWADDFTPLDPRFGTEEELKALVDDAHARGIEVLLDVVYNHAGYDSQVHDQTRGPRAGCARGAGTCGRTTSPAASPACPTSRPSCPRWRDYLLDAQLDRAKRAGLDGFRLDTVKHVDHDVLAGAPAPRRDAELGKDFFLIGEVWGGDAQSLDPWFAGDEMDAGFDFSFQGSALGWLQGRGRTVAFDRYLKSREKVRAGYLLSHYLSSHDVPGALFQLEGDRELFRLAALLQLTDAGHPDDLLRRGGRPPGRRLAGQPERHALGGHATSSPAPASRATRRCAPTTRS